MEMILYDVVLLKLFCVQINFIKSYPYCFYSLPEIETIRARMYEGWIKVKRGYVLSADCYPRLISAPNSYARVLDRAANS